MKINVKRVKENAELPIYGTTGAACFDFISPEDIEWKKEPFMEGEVYTAIIPTGLSFEIPKGYRMDLYPRSGWGFNYNIQLANGTGKIDSDFRGEVMIKLICLSNNPQKIKKGTRFAQGEINEVIKAEFKETSTLSDTERGNKGFGSTGH